MPLLRCPYCSKNLPSPPLPSAVCPHCRKTKEEIARDDLRALAQALTLYRLHTGHYHEESESDLVALVLDPDALGKAHKDIVTEFA